MGEGTRGMSIDEETRTDHYNQIVPLSKRDGGETRLNIV